MTSGNDFFDALKSLQMQGQRVLLPEDTTIKGFLDVDETFPIADSTPEIEERALGTQNYLCVRPNEISNGDFDADLTGWTEDNVSATGTTAQTADESKTAFGSLGSLEIDVTDTSGGAVLGRYQDIAVSVGEILNVEMWLKGNAFVGTARARLRIQWYNGVSFISEEEVASTDVSGAFVQLKLENKTAPATTDTARIFLDLAFDNASESGKAWFDLVRAEKGATTISDRARRIICGEWVCRN